MWFASLILGAALAGGPSAELQRLATGTFELAMAEEAAAASVAAGIEASAASMSWALRGYVRNRLQVAGQWCPGWQVVVDEEHVMVRCLPHWRSELSRRWDAPPEGVKSRDGSSYGMRLEHGEDWVVVAFLSEDGEKAHRFRFTEAGMELEVVVDNPHLPVRPRWTLPYSRAAR